MTEAERYIFSGMRVLLNRTWVRDQAVVVENQMIKAIVPADMIKHHLPATHHKFPHDYLLIPGLIDMHIHGAHGKDVMDGNAAALITISHALAAEGVTGFLATTMTAPDEQINTVLKTIAAAIPNKEGAAILGVHLEGPFIAKAKKGAQQVTERQLDATLISKWQKTAKGTIKIVTLAPELPGAIELIQSLHAMNIIAAVGHTNATYQETCAAIAAGCQYATHLFNAMRGLQQREPGTVGALLLADKVVAELIVDGIHLHPAIVNLALRIKGNAGLLLVSDAMRAKCCGDGEFELGGQTVTVKAGKATLQDGTLAGSTLRLPQAIQNIVQYTDCNLADAIALATENPAHVLGILDKKGTIEIGKDADMVVMDDKFNPVLTFREGQEVFRI